MMVKLTGTDFPEELEKIGVYDVRTVFADGRVLTYEKLRIMGIINATPDSFYDGSRVSSPDNAVKIAEKMLKHGADIIDIGGQSTRPGSSPVYAQEEIKRTEPLIRAIKTELVDCPVSIDTYDAEVAQAAIDAGADMVNDISAMRFDTKMADVIKKNRVPVVLMHIKGRPGNMQDNPSYHDVVSEILSYLQERIKFAKNNGINEDKIIVDPGIGFGKTVEHNLEIMRRISKFKCFHVPVLLGASRKSTIGRVLGDLPPQQRLEGTLALTCHAVSSGVHIVRVHDVLENARAAKMAEALICR
jgi:dihydropteroate synthase